MDTKIIKLVTGEELVSKVGDSLDANGNKVGFSFIFPYKIMMIPKINQETGAQEFDINYVAWMGGSADTSFDVPFGSVVTIGNPVPEVDRMYQERYEEFLEMMNNAN
tara:strand:- start:1234 stop:1554 length:321 start_codon:yes stop_codon:yes gene_type:complete